MLLDGLYYRLGQFVISTTGADDLTFSTTQVLEFGFPFEEIGNTETYIGVSASEITSKQMTIATSDTISRTVAVTSAVGCARRPTLEKTIPVVEELALVPQTAAIVTVNTDEDSGPSAARKRGRWKRRKTTRRMRRLSRILKVPNPPSDAQRPFASNILDTDLVLQALESSPENSESGRSADRRRHFGKSFGTARRIEPIRAIFPKGNRVVKRKPKREAETEAKRKRKRWNDAVEILKQGACTLFMFEKRTRSGFCV